MENRVASLEADFKEHRERSARFERTYVEARRVFGEKLSDIAQGLLDVGEALRTIGTDVRTVKAQTITIDAEVKALRSDFSAHVLHQQSRWEVEDTQHGALLAELASLHGRDQALETTQAAATEEITQMRAITLEQTTRAELERSQKTLRTGVATALGGAVAAYLKANPDAFEKAWKMFGHLFGS